MSKKLRSFKKIFLANIIDTVNDQFKTEFPTIDVQHHIAMIEKKSDNLLIMFDAGCPQKIVRKLTLKLNAIQTISGYSLFIYNYAGSGSLLPGASSATTIH